jgi:H+/Cl- antiporter ClcA
MEVVLREYKVYLFVPVMLAAACGTMLSRAIFGNESELSFLNFQTLEPQLLVYLLVFGFCMGLIGSAFNVQLMWILRRFRKVGMLYRFSLAALITATIGYFIPNALGAEFINVQNIFEQNPSVAYLCLLFVLKFVLATLALGMGIPGGIIGAVMTIGMLAGVILLQPLNLLEQSEDFTATFALLGLAGMLASVLHAPMAALSAAMELSSSPEAVMPCIIVIVTAYVTGKQLCKEQSIFIQQLEFQELKYTSSSIKDVLQKTGVLAVMKTDFDIVKDASETLLYARLQAAPDTFLMNR